MSVKNICLTNLFNFWVDNRFVNKAPNRKLTKNNSKLSLFLSMSKKKLPLLSMSNKMFLRKHEIKMLHSSNWDFQSQ